MQGLGVLGITFMCVGMALCVFGILGFTEWVKKIYIVEYSKIPMMIVDEADIVSYSTDRNGKKNKTITFDQFVYYQVVKCNCSGFKNYEANKMVRRETYVKGKGYITFFEKWGCQDAADLNGDIGRQWLSLYTVKSPSKGNPILADSLTYQTGSDTMPAGCTKGLQFFCYDYALDIGDMAYAYNNDEDGIYLFWKSDEHAFAASSFTGGQLAFAGIGSLAAGILCTTLLMYATRKKKDEPEAPAVA